ncbi:MAG: hypothetical protein COX62_08175 [Deltaproteobacteria bacterium CG_4_10_14_0_2_um_filter_43_8]|nr:MAG: hypothetical protein COV43_07895 [Deltaproteobacteria bacterium CG11_big_fil_rev_8_21_14_0_20_42_23]PJA18766.1 MAG: hypothetical protein COX62_08175 [Deltaproteobacteria bacterium CG_4_10_14_0_2_um_filter_43_8]PJC63914.1 MAG: hypothetical protein CO021_07050 [Deltaproteobacteria bacterium CG_4_9_14_0_2_um_filter_42_21]
MRNIVLAFILLSFCACAHYPVRAEFQTKIMKLRTKVLFDFDKDNIKQTGKPLLQDVATELKKDPRAFLLLEGHTDSTGPKEYNEVLAENRARAVSAYLLQCGVSYRQLTLISKGEREPEDVRLTREAYRKNRRVEVYAQTKSKPKEKISRRKK